MQVASINPIQYQDTKALIVDKINQFYQIRNAMKQKTFQKLFIVTIMILGIFTSTNINFMFYESRSTSITIPLLLTQTIVIGGVNIFASVPSDLLDLSKDESLSIWVQISYAIMCNGLLDLIGAVLTGLYIFPILNILTLFINTKAKWNNFHYDFGLKVCISHILFLLQSSIVYLYIGYSSLFYNINELNRFYIIPKGNIAKIEKIYKHPLLFHIGFIYLIFAILVIQRCYNYRNEHEQEGRMNSTKLNCECFHYVQITLSIVSLLLMIGDNPLESIYGIQKVIHFINFFSWSLIHTIYGSKAICNFFTKPIWDHQWSSYENEEEYLLQNGIFVIQLLEDINIEMNSTWWIHHQDLELPLRPQYSDHRFYWYEGKVVSIDSHIFGVKLLDFSTSIKYFNKKKKNYNNSISQYDMNDAWADEAMNNLRCVDWLNLTEDLFSFSIRDIYNSRFNQNDLFMFNSNPNSSDNPNPNPNLNPNSYYHLSRKLYENERIDYFISHSWSDNGLIKYKKLKHLAEKHYLEYKKYPTFWFDKVCMDQSNILNGLRMLPINIMKCNKMLILSGPTYSTRLWCVWEIFNLVTFLSLETAIRKTIYFSIDEDDEDDEDYNIRSLKRLQSFNVEDCRSYDPNEQNKIFTVIEASGRFNTRVHEFAMRLENSMRLNQ